MTFADTKFMRYLGSGHLPLFIEAYDFGNIGVRNLASAVVLSWRKRISAMRHVLLVSNPLQILNAIIVSFVVHVINLSLCFWIRNKRLGDETVNQEILRMALDAEYDPSVPILVQMGRDVANAANATGASDYTNFRNFISRVNPV